MTVGDARVMRTVIVAMVAALAGACSKSSSPAAPDAIGVTASRWVGASPGGGDHGCRDDLHRSRGRRRRDARRGRRLASTPRVDPATQLELAAGVFQLALQP